MIFVSFILTATSMKFFVLMSFFGALFLSGCATGVGDPDSNWVNENRTAVEEKRDFGDCNSVANAAIQRWFQIGGGCGIGNVTCDLISGREFRACMTQKGYVLVNKEEYQKSLEDKANASECPPNDDWCFGINWRLARVADVKNIDVTMRESMGFTPLHWAAARSNAEVIKHLLEKGANINARGGKRSSFPLYMAGINGNTDAISPLIESGADIDSQDEAGHTPLMGAVFLGQSDFVQALLEKGADPLIKDIYNQTAFDIARKPEAKLKEAPGFWVLKEATENARNRSKKKVPSREISDTSPANEAENAFERGWRSVVVIKTATGQGSGVIIRPNMVATNCHVVNEARGIVVFKADARRAQTDTAHNAVVYKADRKRDLCFLSVSGLWGVPAEIRQGGSLRVGEKVFAIGAPQGLEYSLSAGVVSQLRNGIIQTDTAISPGSSGGGLFDGNGNLVGITTSKLVTESIEGVSFAIPANWILENM